MMRLGCPLSAGVGYLVALSTSLRAGALRMVTVHLLSINSLSDSMTAPAYAWPGPVRSVNTRSIAAVKSEKMV